MACSTSCPTGDHTSFGACLRAKNLKVAYAQEWKGRDATAQKKADRRLDAYQAARAEGIQPDSTRAVDVQRAVRVSDHTGTAYRGDQE